MKLLDGVSWELLIVNNNCTDDTDRVLDNFRTKLPMRRLFEPKLGLSHARNRAVTVAKGTHIVWTDDDVDVDQNWLSEYALAFHRRPDLAVFGGPIRPRFEGSPPAWMQRGWFQIADAYANRELGDHEFVLKQGGALPYGANYAIRLAEQKLWLYDPQLGVAGARQAGGEETMVIEQILGSGARGMWVPTAVVYHRIARHRQTIKYIRNYYRGYGRFLAHADPSPDVRRFLGCPRWIWRQVITSGLRYYGHRIFSEPEAWLEHLKIASVRRGQLRTYLAKRSARMRF